MQYSIFGSILTIGAMIGAIVSGSIADYAGRRVVSFSDSMCIYFSKHDYIFSYLLFFQFDVIGHGVL